MADTAAAPQYFVTPEGGVVSMTPQEAARAPDLGYIQASPQQVKQFQLEQKYGAQPFKAFAESAASTATFGLSTLLEKDLGVSPEAIKARAEYNPLASKFLGPAAGFVGPLLVPGVGEASAPGLIVKAGRAAGAAT